jgi:phosphoribosylformylglycinamidine synthase subunit PurS
VRFDVFVEVQLLAGIADPQGATIERALPALGFEDVHHMRVGRAIRFEVEAASEVDARAHAVDLAEKLLANPVMERADITVTAAAALPGR